MKKIILSSVIVTAAAVSAQAQLRTQTTGLREARKQLEVQTENTVLEKLETARLEDERNRREHFETLNFSVVNDTTQNNYARPSAQQAYQQVPVQMNTQRPAMPAQNMAPVPVVIAPGYN